MLIPFHPVLYTEAVAARYGEPSRLSSDRSDLNATPVSVDHLYAPDTPGAFQPADDRARRWITEGTMCRHREPVLVRYVVEHPGAPALTGLVGLVDLTETTILPHEATTASEVAARLADLERAGALLEPIMLIVSPGAGPVLDEGSPLRTVDYDGETHRIQALKPEDVHWPDVGRPQPFVIADGHHRVQAIIQHARDTGDRPLGLVMVVETLSPGLRVEPQHRVLAGEVPQRPVTTERFSVLPFSPTDSVPSGAVGIVTAQDAWLMAPRFKAHISAVVLEEHVAPSLDLTIAGVATRQRDAVAEVSHGAAAAAIMGPITKDTVVAEARRGRLLPHKASCFSPKLAVGLVGALLGVDSA